MKKQPKHKRKRPTHASEETASKLLRIDADGSIYEPGKPQRVTPRLWNWDQRKLPNGQVVAAIVPPSSPDSITTVLHEATLLDPELHLAQAVVRTNPHISIADLRKTFPELDKRFSDKHFAALKESEGRIRSTRKFIARVFSDASGYFDENTVYRYLKFKHSRQIKKPHPGRPRK
jgi:hypothetical protein